MPRTVHLLTENGVEEEKIPDPINPQQVLNTVTWDPAILAVCGESKSFDKIQVLLGEHFTDIQHIQRVWWKKIITDEACVPGLLYYGSSNRMSSNIRTFYQRICTRGRSAKSLKEEAKRLFKEKAKCLLENHPPMAIPEGSFDRGMLHMARNPDRRTIDDCSVVSLISDLLKNIQAVQIVAQLRILFLSMLAHTLLSSKQYRELTRRMQGNMKDIAWGELFVLWLIEVPTLKELKTIVSWLLETYGAHIPIDDFENLHTIAQCGGPSALLE